MTSLPEMHVVESGDNPQHAIIWLHGLGADGFDFEPLVPELAQGGLPPVRFVFPHAPVRPVTINNGFRMRAWYDIADLDFEQRADLQGVQESIEIVQALIDDQIGKGIAPGNIILAGFSQGGAIILSYLLKGATPIRAAIALSTYVPAVSQAITQAQAQSRATDTRIFMAHGQMDPVIPFAIGQGSAVALQSLGYDVAWHGYPMQHQLCGPEVADLRTWLSQVMATAVA